MTATLSTISLSQELIREIDDAVAETGLSRDDLLHAAVRRFLRSDRRWRELRQGGSLELITRWRLRPVGSAHSASRLHAVLGGDGFGDTVSTTETSRIEPTAHWNYKSWCYNRNEHLK